MEKIFKIWILSLITFVLVYLAVTNRYIVFPQTNTKYDRWMHEQSRIEEYFKPIESDREKIEAFIKLRELLNKSDESKLTRLAPSWTDVLLKDSLDIKIDSLLREAISLNRQIENPRIIQKLSELISEMKKTLENKSKK